MEITDSWTTEYARKKFGVTLDETDWADFLVGCGLSPGTKVPLAVKFELLRMQAAVFSLRALAEYLAGNPDAGDAVAVDKELAEKKETLEEWRQGLKERHGS